MKKIFLILFLILISRLTLALTITPARIETSQAPGEEKEYHFSIKNTREEPVIIKLSVYDFDIDINGKILTKERKSLPNWITIAIKQARISPGRLKTISFMITLSTDATGEKRCLFYFQEIPTEKGGVATALRIGSAVYCTVKGTEEVDGETKDFIAFPSKIILTFCNNGNVHLRPEILMEIKNQQGEIIREISLVEGFPVLPFHKYIIERKFKQKLETGDYTAIIQTRYGMLYDEEFFEIKEVPFGIFKVK